VVEAHKSNADVLFVIIPTSITLLAFINQLVMKNYLKIIDEKVKVEDVYVCHSCEINSTKERFCPCPRGGCEAFHYGTIISTKSFQKLPEAELSSPL
jgi:hypothetical protein